METLYMSLQTAIVKVKQNRTLVNGGFYVDENCGVGRQECVVRAALFGLRLGPLAACAGLTRPSPPDPPRQGGMQALRVGLRSRAAPLAHQTIARSLRVSAPAGELRPLLESP